MEFKCRHLVEFLIQGHKVKATIIFIGRMMVHQDIGRKLMDEILEKLTVVGKIEQPPKMEGRYLSVMLIPEKKKIDDYKKNLDKSKPLPVSTVTVSSEKVSSEPVNTEEVSTKVVITKAISSEPVNLEPVNLDTKK